MSLLAVTIPAKEIILDFNINDVKNAIIRLPEMLDNCKMLDKNDVVKKYDICLTSALSLGNKLSCTISEVSENKTKLVVEVTRMVGTFDKSSEVSRANKDYALMVDALSKLLGNPNMTNEEMKKYRKEKSNKGSNIVIWILFIIGVLYILSK